MRDKCSGYLIELIKEHGDDLLNDRNRLIGLLYDSSHGSCLEVRVLVHAYDSNVHMEICRHSGNRVVLSVQKLLVNKLQHDHGISQDLALWAVESWAQSLNYTLVQEQKTQSEHKKLFSDPLNICTSNIANSISSCKNRHDNYLRRSFFLIGIIFCLFLILFFSFSSKINQYFESKNYGFNNPESIDYGFFPLFFYGFKDGGVQVYFKDVKIENKAVLAVYIARSSKGTVSRGIAVIKMSDSSIVFRDQESSQVIIKGKVLFDSVSKKWRIQELGNNDIYESR